MVLEEETKIVQSRNAYTQYPFREGERVKITVDPYRKIMIVSSVEEPYIKVSRKGIFVKKRIEVVER